MKIINSVKLGVFAVAVLLVHACASDVPEAEMKAAIAARATSASMPCNEIGSAESRTTTTDQGAMEAACSLSGDVETGGDASDPGLITWCDNGVCCAADRTGPICCCAPGWGCGCG